MNPLSITTASGRRVSILCEDDSPCLSSYSNRSYPTGSYFPPMSMAPTPPLSPDYVSRRPCLADRSDSFCSTASSSPLTPPTPEYLSLPPLDRLVGKQRPSYDRRMSCASSVSSSAAQSPVLSPTIIAEEDMPESPQSAASPGASAVIKKSTRKYTCNCGKSFTTSGHLARHSRIHTGEKNYECPEQGCGARFSRQDNCMQHYRTHQNGGANKRTSRKKRTDAPALASHHSSRFVPQMPSFSPENSLAALASVAISNYS